MLVLRALGIALLWLISLGLFGLLAAAALTSNTFGFLSKCLRPLPTAAPYAPPSRMH